MRIYSRHTYNVFREEYPRAAQALQSWYQEAEKAKWRTPQDVKEQYSVTASIIPNNRVVFNIMGGEYRLITEVSYKWSTIFIHFFGTRAEYDKVDAATVKLRK